MKESLKSVYSDPSLQEITQKDVEEYSVIRYGAPNGFVIDIISHVGSEFSYADLESETIDFNGLKVRVATPETLLKMKSGTLRPKDKIDTGFLQELIKAKKAGR